MKSFSIFCIACMLVTTIAEAAEFRIFRSDPQALVIYMTGNIDENDPKKLQTILISNPFSKEKYLVLHSFGGVVDAGIEMGQAVRNAEVRTIIPITGRCLGACSIVFVAGWGDIRLTSARYTQVQRALGIDRPHNVNLKSADPHVLKAVQTYFEFIKTGKAHDRLSESIPPQKMQLIKKIKTEAMDNHKVVGLSETQNSSKELGVTKTQKTSRASKRRSRKAHIKKQQQLERWRRSFLEID